MKVSQIMTSNPVTCGPDSDLEMVARKMVEHDCGVVPVVDGDHKPLGVVTDRDIVCRAVAKGRNPRELRASDVMTAPAVTCSPDSEIEQCAGLFEDRKIRRVVVVDEGGRCIGVVAQADLALKAPTEKTGQVVREVSQPMHASSH